MTKYRGLAASRSPNDRHMPCDIARRSAIECIHFHQKRVNDRGQLNVGHVNTREPEPFRANAKVKFAEPIEIGMFDPPQRPCPLEIAPKHRTLVICRCVTIAATLPAGTSGKSTLLTPPPHRWRAIPSPRATSRPACARALPRSWRA